MTEFYARIYWLNKSDSLTTPLGKTNLNKMDSAIKTLDGRTIELYTETVRLDTAKADKTQLKNMVTNWQIDDRTGIVTLTKYDGTKITINTALNQLAVNFEYDAIMQQLIITQTDGTQKIVDLSALITQYEFLDTDTITFSVDTSGKVSAIVKEGSINEKHLDPDYLADIKVQMSKAEGYAKDAQDSADNATYDAKLSQSYAVGGSGIREDENTDNSKYYYGQTKELAENAKTITSYTTEYQAGTNGSTPPDGEWKTEVPTVQQGQYLWTRITINLSNGENIVAYSVSYFGEDGDGGEASSADIAKAIINSFSDMNLDFSNEAFQNKLTYTTISGDDPQNTTKLDLVVLNLGWKLGNYGIQIGANILTSRKFIRSCVNGTYSDWYEILTTRNYKSYAVPRAVEHGNEINFGSWESENPSLYNGNLWFNYREGIKNSAATRLIEKYIFGKGKATSNNDNIASIEATNGIFRGCVTAEQGFFIKDERATNATAGWINFMRIKVTDKYFNYPIFVIIGGRTYHTVFLDIRFQDTDNTDPEMDSIYRFGGTSDTGIYYKKTSTSTWDFYMQKSEVHGAVNIKFISIPPNEKGATAQVTYPNTQVDSVPSGSTVVLYGGVISQSHAVVDTGNGQKLTFSYNKPAVDWDTIVWLAAWNGTEIRAINRKSFMVYMHTSSVDAINTINNAPIVFNLENGGGDLVSGYKNFWHVINLGGYTGGGYTAQLAIPYENSIADSEIFLRVAKGSTYRLFRRLVHEGNYTAIVKKVESVIDYGDVARSIKIGYGGTGLNSSTATHFAAYTENGTKIKDLPITEAKKLLALMGLVNKNGYLGMTKPDGGDTSAFIRTTKEGLLPYEQGNFENGHSDIGSYSWYFDDGYISKIYNKKITIYDEIIMYNKDLYNKNAPDSGRIKAYDLYGLCTYNAYIAATQNRPMEEMSNYFGTSLPMIHPVGDNVGYLGMPEHRYKQVYAVSSTISTSDRRLKKDISYIGQPSEYGTAMSDELLVQFMEGLLPCIFLRTEGESGRPHHGLIAQDIEELMKRLGIKDHACFIKSPKTRTVEVEVEREVPNEDGTIELKVIKEPQEEEIPGEYIYGLRYEEFIGDIIRYCQILWDRIEEQDKIIKQQKEEMNDFKSRLEKLEAIMLY